MSSTHPFISLLVGRGTRADGASNDQLLELSACHPALPPEILNLLRVQNGEDPMLTFGMGYRFLSTEEIAQYIRVLREMVEDDETLPAAFLEFVPFLHTEVKTDVGIFTARSDHFPREVIEYDYETGAFIRWALTVPAFVQALARGDGSYHRFGCQFPADGQSAFEASIHFQPSIQPTIGGG